MLAPFGPPTIKSLATALAVILHGPLVLQLQIARRNR